MTEALASLEGLEKGPAGNTSLAAAFSLAQRMGEDEIIIVQETEYTGAGKHVNAQLSFARKNGIEIRFGDPSEETPGKDIILPAHPSLISARPVDMERLRRSFIRNAVNSLPEGKRPTDADIDFLAGETKASRAFALECVHEITA